MREMGKITGHLHQATPRLIGNNGCVLVFWSSEKPIRKQMIYVILWVISQKSNQDTLTIHHHSCPRAAWREQVTYHLNIFLVKSKIKEF